MATPHMGLSEHASSGLNSYVYANEAMRWTEDWPLYDINVQSAPATPVDGRVIAVHPTPTTTGTTAFEGHGNEIAMYIVDTWVFKPWQEGVVRKVTTGATDALAGKAVTWDGTAVVEIQGSGSGTSLPVNDTTALVKDPVDATKTAGIDAGAISTASFRRIIMPDSDVTLRKNNLAAGAAPTVNDDSTLGYAPGSSWVDLVGGNEYVLITSTAGAAVWKNRTTAAGGGGVSGPLSSTDNALSRWDGTGGNTLQDSVVVIDDLGNVTGLGTLNGVSITAHAARHQSGGADAIKLDDLAAPDDNTTLNASVSAHGLLPKLSGTATTYLDGTGQWTTPAGGGGASLPISVSSAINLFADTVAPTKILRFSLSSITAGFSRIVTWPDQNLDLTPNATFASLPIPVSSGIDTFRDSTNAAATLNFNLSALTTQQVATWPNASVNLAIDGSGSFLVRPITASSSLQLFVDSVDPTKQLRFNLNGISTATVKTITWPNQSLNLTPNTDFASLPIPVSSGIDTFRDSTNAAATLNFVLTALTTQRTATWPDSSVNFAVNNTGSFSNLAHASRHADGGGDEIKLDDLGTPDDNTDLNASTLRHGLLPKLSGDATAFLNGTGTWTVPAGGGGGGLTNAYVAIAGNTGTAAASGGATLNILGDDTTIASTAADGTPDSVTFSVKASGINTTQLANLAVTTGKLADGAVTTAKLGDVQVTTGKLADGAVTTAKLGDAQITLAKMADLAQAVLLGRNVGAGTGVPQALSQTQSIELVRDFNFNTAALNILDVLNSPPATPAAHDTYLAGETPALGWSGYAAWSVVMRDASNTAWINFTPKHGWRGSVRRTATHFLKGQAIAWHQDASLWFPEAGERAWINPVGTSTANPVFTGQYSQDGNKLMLACFTGTLSDNSAGTTNAPALNVDHNLTFHSTDKQKFAVGQGSSGSLSLFFPQNFAGIPLEVRLLNTRFQFYYVSNLSSYSYYVRVVYPAAS